MRAICLAIILSVVNVATARDDDHPNIVFIMSDEAGSMTGSVVAVDGGWTAG